MSANDKDEPDKQGSIYDAAKRQWDQRIGDAQTQLRNWRLATMIALLVLVLLLAALLVVISTQKRYVYLAQIKPGQSVASMQPVQQKYTPSQAQQAYFIGQFIRNIMVQPLDPVQLRQRWQQAYDFAQGRALDQLTAFARQEQPFSTMGTQTKEVIVQNYHVISNHTFEFNWQRKTYNQDGKVISTHAYSGLFTISQTSLPKTSKQLLINPLGLKINYFSIKQEE